jgi:hypothetical protein
MDEFVNFEARQGICDIAVKMTPATDCDHILRELLGKRPSRDHIASCTSQASGPTKLLSVIRRKMSRIKTPEPKKTDPNEARVRTNFLVITVGALFASIIFKIAPEWGSPEQTEGKWTNVSDPDNEIGDPCVHKSDSDRPPYATGSEPIQNSSRVESAS